MKQKTIQNLGGLPQSNLFDAVPDFTKTVHIRENSRQNEAHLNENRQKFTGQCAILYSLLMKGEVLSSYKAMVQYGIGHLARRIKDLKDDGHIAIDEQFEYNSDGKTTRNKIWFMKDKISPQTAQRYNIQI